MCDCENTDVVIPVRGRQGLSACASITADMLLMYRRILVCAIGLKPDEKLSGLVDILNSWINAKELDPSTCQYYEYFQIIQNQVEPILSKGNCL